MAQVTEVPAESPEIEPGIEAEAAADAIYREVASTLPRRPLSTYRLQLHKDFRFVDAEKIVDYLDALGVTDAYFSPYLAARVGSTHGYDVIDHTRLNPEIGDEATHQHLLDHLKRRGMGRVLDIVPNHMGFSAANPLILDILENGPQARSADFFDIDWSPIKDSLEGRVLLPILGDFYGNILESGQLVLARHEGSFVVRYHEREFPLRPRSYARVLDRRADVLQARFGPRPDVLEYLSIRDAARNLPECRFCRPEEVDQIRREKEVIKRRVHRLCDESPEIRAFLDENVDEFRGHEGDPSSFDLLADLLDDQVYRLAYWRVASEEINYRRFFDVTELVGIKVELPEVFDHVHRLIFRWIREGGVTGLRVDHPDGLADPRGYFRRVQERLFLQECQAVAAARGVPWEEVGPALAGRFDAAVVAEPAATASRRFPVMVEKILSTGERLPADWPIDGTVGYEYLNALNGLFVNPEASEAIDGTYREFTGDPDPFPEALRDSKLYVERALLASELNNLTRLLSRAAEVHRQSRDFTTNDLRRALVETVACFRVYRTYIKSGEEVSDRDRDYVEQAVARARSRQPTVDPSVFAFLREVLLLRYPADLSAADRKTWERFATRFQQTTGPVQAKGLEDTTFYRQVPLVSVNEVGGDPSRYAASPSAFHAQNLQRLTDWPGGLSTTATHDTKRGEDARIRINVISELAEEWKTRLARWSRWNARKKSVVGERSCPDAREEYLLYQTLLGAWPFDPSSDSVVPEGLVERVQAYVVKAASEAKRNTTWTDPDSSYKDALSKYVADILEGPDAAPFLNDFLAFQRRVASVGVCHSLSQTLLKLVSPGVADVYQGAELWDLSLVDPDNRRPVDYDARRAILARIKDSLERGDDRARLARDLFARPDDGAIKLYVIWSVLNHRREFPDLYLKGAYRPVEVSGARKENVVALARTHQNRAVLAVAPRLVAGLSGDDAGAAPLGPDVWGDTELAMPDVGTGRWINLLTGEAFQADRPDEKPVLRVAQLFLNLPLAFLVHETK